MVELIEAELLTAAMKREGLSCFSSKREQDLVSSLLNRVGLDKAVLADVTAAKSGDTGNGNQVGTQRPIY